MVAVGMALNMAMSSRPIREGPSSPAGQLQPLSYLTLGNGSEWEVLGALKHADLSAHAVFYLYWFSAHSPQGRQEGRAEGDRVPAVKPEGGCEGKHRIRGNKRIANTSRPHVFVLGDTVEKQVREGKKVNLLKMWAGVEDKDKRGRQCAVHSSPAASH